MKPFVPQRRNKWALFILVVLFLAGIVAAYVLVESGWRPTTTKNYGELVQPARLLVDAAFTDAQGREVKFSSLKGKWTLLYFGAAECLKPCVDNLYKMRQITAAQGADEHRVQQAFIVTDPRARDLLRYTMVDYPATIVLFASSETVRVFAAQFSLAAGTPLDGLNRIYVVDPLGNFMMSYPADADPVRMNKDLKLLLRASHIG